MESYKTIIGMGSLSVAVGQACKWGFSFETSVCGLIDRLRDQWDNMIKNSSLIENRARNNFLDRILFGRISDEVAVIANLVKQDGNIWIEYLDRCKFLVKCANETAGKSAFIAAAVETSLTFYEVMRRKEKLHRAIDIAQGAMRGAVIGLAIGCFSAAPPGARKVPMLTSMGIGLLSGGIGAAVGSMSAATVKWARNLRPAPDGPSDPR